MIKCPDEILKIFDEKDSFCEYHLERCTYDVITYLIFWKIIMSSTGLTDCKKNLFWIKDRRPISSNN